jgi:hypothetical protein
MSKDIVTTECETKFLAQFEDIDDATDEQVEEFATAWCEEVNEGSSKDVWKIGLCWYEDYANNDTCGEKGILSGDWNNVSRPVQNLLERAGYTLDWCDAVCSCGGCGKAIQTQPSHYGWKPEYVVSDGDILCESCVEEDPEDMLEELRGNPNKALTLDSIDLNDHGYVRVERDFEHGWHPGQDDSPKAIAKTLRERGIEDFIFSLDDVGQFDARFSVWVKREDAPAAADVEGKCDEPPNVTLDRALKSIPASTGEGIQYNRVSTDGSVTTTYLTPEQFIAGVKE